MILKLNSKNDIFVQNVTCDLKRGCTIAISMQVFNGSLLKKWRKWKYLELDKSFVFNLLMATQRYPVVFSNEILRDRSIKSPSDIFDARWGDPWNNRRLFTTRRPFPGQMAGIQSSLHPFWICPSKDTPPHNRSERNLKIVGLY